MKKCALCKENKSLNDFNNKSSSDDGKQNICRDCNRERSRRYYKENREKHIEYVNRAKGGKDCITCGKLFRSKHRNLSCESCRSEKKKVECPLCDGKMNPKSSSCRSCRIQSGKSNPSWKGGKVNTSGYVYVRVGSKYVPEHRIVMEEHIGRDLLEHENVHHKNGIRDDNHIDNLELWTRPQPSGIRAKDALEWARTIITEYESIEDKI